ncbi:MAG: DEAD/DEAH box helicase [Bacteroidota bacterium]
MKVISELGFEKPSEIQEKAIPQLLEGDHDFIGLANTGTGKTAAFSLPLLERIDPTIPATQALILAPTRELGQQIAEQIATFGKYLDKINILAVYGGASISHQIKALRRPQHIIIATPGRLIDLIQRKSVKLDELEYLVLDEADEMLNMGFQQEIDKILTYTPEEKLVWLFSATLSKDIGKIVQNYMDDPIEVRLTKKKEVNANIEHQFTLVKRANKAEALTRFLDVDPDIRGVVFCRTRRDTQELADILSRKKYRADALHGDLSQRQRDKVMDQFRSNRLQLLVATDIAARGIDVNDLTHVFHFNLPDDIAYYTHRSGRTARAGKKGTSIAFINGRDMSRLDYMKRQLGISFKRVFIPSSEDIYEKRIASWCQQILDTRIKGKMDDELVEKANLLFGNLSKEELIAKIVMNEVDKFDHRSTRDLNETLQRSNRDRDRDRDRDRRSHNRDRKNYGHNGGRNRSKSKSYSNSKSSNGRKRRPTSKK